MSKIQRCKFEVKNLTSGKSTLKDKNYKMLSQTMKTVQLCKQPESWIELHTKILQDSECNFLDLTNCRSLRNTALAEQREDDRTKTRLNMSCNWYSQHN